MSLTMVATPIGCAQDITHRAEKTLREADIIVFEERKESAGFLRTLGLSFHDTNKKYYQLNEHSTDADVEALADLCQSSNVALITDCGTPGFADPGAHLVAACRKRKIQINSAPGASSLMCLLSLTSVRLSEFVFRGFLSAESDLRKKQWRELHRESRAIVIMDTPYRLQKVLNEIKENFPQRRFLLGLNFTQPDEWIFDGLIHDCHPPVEKAEFMLMLYPATQMTHGARGPLGKQS